MPKVKSQWDEKFIREQPFMAFGSMMNAYGRINEGKGMPLDAFIIAADKIFKATMDYALQAYDSVQKEDNMDIPVKRAKR
jgi:hypothetical protein